jgi:hypothetical protein
MPRPNIAVAVAGTPAAFATTGNNKDGWNLEATVRMNGPSITPSG